MFKLFCDLDHLIFTLFPVFPEIPSHPAKTILHSFQVVFGSNHSGLQCIQSFQYCVGHYNQLHLQIQEIVHQRLFTLITVIILFLFLPLLRTQKFPCLQIIHATDFFTVLVDRCSIPLVNSKLTCSHSRFILYKTI